MFVPENASSGRVMDKLGMTHHLTTTDPTSGGRLEVRAITREAWQEAQV